MSAQTLRAEARAWRHEAAFAERHRFTRVLGRQRWRRWARHFFVVPIETRPYGVVWQPLKYDLVLACLFLALECEDEAKEAT